MEDQNGWGTGLKGSFLWERSAGRGHVQDFELHLSSRLNEQRMPVIRWDGLGGSQSLGLSK